MNMYAKFQLHPPYDFWGEDKKFENVFENLPFMLSSAFPTRCDSSLLWATEAS